jgi:predicted MPP superfamily phosphohydrolase
MGAHPREASGPSSLGSGARCVPISDSRAWAWLDVLAFAHISDIHFSSLKRDNAHDLDETLRNELRHDLSAQAERIGGLSGLLITGDVAGSGQPVEYARAADWLAELCREIGIGTENVWVIAGNHDVNWKEHSVTNEVLRNHLARAPELVLDQELQKILNDKVSAEHLLAPLDNYTKFARKFGSAATPQVPYWICDFDLSDGYVLRVRGMNSALISDETDQAKKPRLVLGAFQSQLSREPGTVHVAMCHHPADWLRDGQVLNMVHENAALLMTGHEHHSDVRRVGTRRSCLWIAAGALHPERDDPKWKPRYNIVTVDLLVDSRPATVEVCVIPRAWDGTARFAAGLAGDGKEGYQLQLDEVAAKPNRAVGVPAERYQEPIANAPIERLADRRVRLHHRLAELLVSARHIIARSMGLTLGEITSIGETDLPDQIIHRAEEAGRLAELWDLVEAGHGQAPTANPYADADKDA